MAKVLMVVGALVLVTAVIFLVVQLIGTVENVRKESKEFKEMQEKMVAERLAKVGRVHAGDVNAAPPERSGEEIYTAICSSCHKAGVLGAPKVGDKSAWGPRLKMGFEALVASAVKGKGSMPPRGGVPSLSDQDIKKAVAYMLKQTGLPVPDVEGKDKGKGEAQEGAGQQAAAQPAQAAPAAPAAGAAAAASAPAAPAATPAAAPAAPAPAGATGKPATAASPAAGLYRSACAACHDTGAAGAPRLGDGAAWSARLAQGKAALYQSALNGKGAMPPKGGRLDLSDAQVQSIVDYMVGQAQ